MKKSYLLLITLQFLCLILMDGCKSAKKSLKRGDYDDSVLRAAEKLKDNPNHSASLEILKTAYPSALQQHLDQIDRNKGSMDLFRWENEVADYSALNKLYKSLNQCNVCMRAVDPRRFEAEERDARNNAADVRYKEAGKLLAVGDRENARQAYGHFEKVRELIPNYGDVAQKMDLAMELATFKVVVEQVLVTSKVYQLSNEYFQERVNDYLQSNRRMNKFVRFYTPDEASAIKLRPDHVITLQFDDFVVGQTLIEKNTETVTSQDSVKVSERQVGRAKVPVYGKVTAKFTKSRKTVHSSGLLDMQIRDYKTKRLVNQEKFTGEYNWMCEWASFNGDERALTSAQLRMSKSQELVPPAPQQLFIEFSKPIYDRLTSKLQTFYAKY